MQRSRLALWLAIGGLLVSLMITDYKFLSLKKELQELKTAFEKSSVNASISSPSAPATTSDSSEVKVTDAEVVEVLDLCVVCNLGVLHKCADQQGKRWDQCKNALGMTVCSFEKHVRVIF